MLAGSVVGLCFLGEFIAELVPLAIGGLAKPEHCCSCLKVSYGVSLSCAIIAGIIFALLFRRWCGQPEAPPQASLQVGCQQWRLVAPYHRRAAAALLFGRDGL